MQSPGVRRQIYLEYDAGSCIRAAVRENGALTEMFDSGLRDDAVGNIYAARVCEFDRGTGACFVSLGSRPGSGALKGYLSSDSYRPGDFLPVRIERPAAGNKFCMCSDALSVPSAYFILLLNDPGAGVHISRKISDPGRRAELSALSSELLSDCAVPETTGMIVRTAADAADEITLRKAFSELSEKAGDIMDKFRSVRGSGDPGCIFRVDPLFAVANAFPASTVSELYYNDPAAENAFARICGETAGAHFYCPGGIMEKQGIDREYSAVSGRTVTLPSGGNIVIERTEAATVIDVNTSSAGRKRGAGRDVIFSTNKEAASEIMRQIRLRNLGGMILCDFINMASPEEEAAIAGIMREKAAFDPSQVNVEGFTRLKIMELTRRRLS